jgi:hypothetical protein
LRVSLQSRHFRRIALRGRWTIKLRPSFWVQGPTARHGSGGFGFDLARHHQRGHERGVAHVAPRCNRNSQDSPTVVLLVRCQRNPGRVRNHFSGTSLTRAYRREESSAKSGSTEGLGFRFHCFTAPSASNPMPLYRVPLLVYLSTPLSVMAAPKAVWVITSSRASSACFR